MDIFEKQQVIESVKTIVKARWFVGAAVFVQGLIVKIFFKNTVPLAGTSVLTFLVIGYFLGNFLCWLYSRRPAEKMSGSAIRVFKLVQVPLDQLAFSAVIYFSGTATKLLVLLYPMTLVIASCLYRRRGVFLAAFSAVAAFSGLAILEYLGIIRPESAVGSSFTRFVEGDKVWLGGQLLGFTTYMLGTAFMASFVADLFRTREKRQESQKLELAEKTKLTAQRSEELMQTKDWLHEALTKSDKTRAELAIAKEELEKMNQELEGKVSELEKFSKATVGREMKMMVLKGEIETLKSTVNNLQEKLGGNNN